MRIVLYILTVLLINGWRAGAAAEDLYLGRVLSVDRDAGSLTVLLVDEASDALDSDSTAGEPVEVRIHPDRLPPFLSEGSIVRIWGDIPDEASALTATRLYALGQGFHGKDPTGVRRRIGKSRSAYGGKGGGRGRGRR